MFLTKLAQVSWKLEGTVADSGDQIFVDFSPKGGPKALTGTWDKDGIKFPDGEIPRPHSASS